MTLPYSMKEHTIDWQTGERVTLAEFERRMKTRPKKRSKKHGTKTGN